MYMRGITGRYILLPSMGPRVIGPVSRHKKKLVASGCDNRSGQGSMERSPSQIA